ncbi:hypothetical protein FJ960_01905 [Mesorhizobium sp. B2-3-11]|uniref:hypothetical protein n=1 Tax=Mesorhizobium sp. B2-3-11 TaxID=2589953 RepID=UPI00112EEBBB|nr:hypothetical protein [Mesorhizobium sp. B2-3-11]TPM11521.1 hypothetical protein FJ960_01905 [Mesorhizobium sp. B2-3-11]
MTVPAVGFIPRITSVSANGSGFDLTCWHGVRAWLAAGQGQATERFGVHPDDIAALAAAIKQEIANDV